MFNMIWSAIKYMIADHRKVLAMHKDITGCLVETFRSTLPPSTPSSLASASLSLRDLVVALNVIHNKQVNILIDEYDSPLNEAFTEGYYQQATEIFRKFFLDAFVGEESRILKVCLMGILELDGVGIFSNTSSNIVEYCSIASPLFIQSLGFTEEEIDGLVNKTNSGTI
jgi:Predicted AAA-ATPase